MDRLNVSITGMAASSGVVYFPSWTEISVTMLIVAIGFGVFAFAVKNLTIFSETEAPEGSYYNHGRVEEGTQVHEPTAGYQTHVAVEH
jgi:Ni/Fe-hydrogenase subunit HybB-like protein